MTTTQTKEMGGWVIRGYVAGKVVTTAFTFGGKVDATTEALLMRARWAAQGGR
jgi:hypothetical protein